MHQCITHNGYLSGQGSLVDQVAGTWVRVFVMSHSSSVTREPSGCLGRHAAMQLHPHSGVCMLVRVSISTPTSTRHSTYMHWWPSS